MKDQKIRIREVVIVEGKHDKIKLDSILDALILETRGFGIFKDKGLLNLFRRLANERGLLVLTDSDSAGFVIRDYLNGAIPPGLIKHAYIPQLIGREKRKSSPSKEGFLGVEGVDRPVIVAALERAGATLEQNRNHQPLTKADLYEAGLSGKLQSAQRRARLLSMMGLPKTLSSNRLLQVLNATITREDFNKFLTL